MNDAKIDDLGRDNYCVGSWEEFNNQLKKTPVGNHGNLGFFFLDAEITPKTLPGTFRFDSNNNNIEEFSDKGFTGSSHTD